jgi:beta-glucosidase
MCIGGRHDYRSHHVRSVSARSRRAATAPLQRSATVGFGVIAAEVAVGRETKTLAAKADVAIVCFGFDPSSEGEGFDRPFRLPGGQDELIRQVAAVNQNTIVE